MTLSNDVDVKAYSLPPIKDPNGEEKIPVVTSVHQGRMPVAVGADSDLEDIHTKVYPVRLFVLVDISMSMDGAKLDLVKTKIDDFINTEDLPDDIEYVVIPYDDKVRKPIIANSAREFGDAIQSLEIGNYTNIYEPICTAKELVASFKDDKRNLMALVSDGQITAGPKENEIVGLIKDSFADLDIGAYCIGVGVGYTESLMKAIQEAAGFGGATHVPEEKGHKEVFKELFPNFIKEMRSVDYYPIVSFNKWFDKVINLNPSIKNVKKQSIPYGLKGKLHAKGADQHYPSVLGYQNSGFSVGFVDRDKLDNGKAELFSIIKAKSNQKRRLSVEQIQVTPLEDAIGLDPAEREIIEKAPLKACIDLLLQKRDPDAIEGFLENNPNLGDEDREMLEGLKVNLAKFNRTAADEQKFRADASHSSIDIGSLTQVLHVRDLQPDDSDQAMKGTDGGMDGGTRTIDSDDLARLVGRINPNDGVVSDNLGSDLAEINITKVSGPGDMKISDHLKLGANLGIRNKDQVSVGRGLHSDISISRDHAISRDHCVLVNDAGRFYIENKSQSNGFKHNDRLTYGRADLESGDYITIGQTTFQLQF